jgi:hypothetical protein
MKGFSPSWCKWIASFMEESHVEIKINDQACPNFKTKKGVRHEDPLSPILFNIVVDILAIIINRAKNESQIDGMIPNIIDDGLSILEHVDNTILLVDHNIDQARNMKLIPTTFEKIFGLKINFH